MCIPILLGCETRITSEHGDNPPRVCAKCHNPAVQKAKSRTWFSAFCVPLFPFTSTHIYKCSVCGWEIKQDAGFEPPIAGQQQQHGPGGTYPPSQGMPKPGR